MNPTITDFKTFDILEKRVIFDMMEHGRTLAEATQICINNVEGDYSQLSEGIKKFIKEG